MKSASSSMKSNSGMRISFDFDEIELGLLIR